jgi:hypothetical protein
MFGSKYFVLNEYLRVTKFNSKSIEGTFVWYSMINKLIEFTSHIKIIIESVHVKFNESANNETEKCIDIVGVELP